MSKRIQHTKSIVTISFIVIISLCLLGIVLMYIQLVKFSEVSDSTTERKELVVISNTLASLYKAEGAGNLLIAESLPEVRNDYDSLMNRVYFQIDSLRKISKEAELQVHLDSVTILLNKKQANTLRMFQLLDSVNKKMVIPVSRTTIITKRELDDLDQMLKNQITIRPEDTINLSVPKEKKNFFQRVKNVFKSEQDKQDTSIVISAKIKENIEAVYIPSLTDTLVDYVNDAVWDYNKRNSKFMNKLIVRQGAMHAMNEELTVQINKILRDIETREYENSLILLKEKEMTLKRSSRIAYVVSIVTLFFTIIFLVIILRSISFNQKYRTKLENANKYAEDLLAAKERLILTITHDIKAPVSSIIGYIELLLNSKLPERERYYIENMQNSAEHVIRLVKDLLDFHSLDTESQKINIMSFSPHKLMKDIWRSFIPQATSNNIKLEFVCQEEKDATYKSDPYRIRQIVNNLISNALKFTQSGGNVILTTSLSRSQSKKMDLLVISVKDNGRGIKKEDQEFIFEEFRRINAGKIEGSGLGLTITKKLVKLLKGEIFVSSELGKGSEFTVKIPIKQTKSKEEVEDIFPEKVAETISKIPSAIVDTKKKILFIDDDIVQLNLFSELLKRKGFVPTVCPNSVDALDLIQKNSYDMIFTDIQMPDMNGFELVERIRMATFADSKTIPVIALSASSNISEQKYAEAGFTGFLAKPFNANQLMDIIALYLGGEDICMPIRNNNELKGFDSLVKFAYGDNDAAQEIINSFIEENRKNIILLKTSIENDNWDTVKSVSHKMLPLMRMISETSIVHILCEFEKGLQDKSKGEDLIAKVGALLTKATYYSSKFNAKDTE